MTDNPKHNTAIICLSPYYGGMEMDAIRYARLLSSSSRVFLIAKKDSLLAQHYSSDSDNDNITFFTIPFSSNLSFSIIFGVRKIVKQNNIRNVIFFGASELKSLYFSFAGLDINLLIRHGTTKSRSKKDLLHKLIYSKVNWHIAICQHIADNVRQIIPFGKSTRLKVIYSSLRFNPAGPASPEKKETDTVTLLHVSRITDGKGQLDAVRACAALYEKNIPFRLVCVGELDPNYASTMTAALAKIPYRSAIELPGFSNSVSEYYHNADIFIFPSKGEGLSNAFIEALASGLICIAYNNTSFPELQQAGFRFYMAQDQDITDLESVLLEAVEYRNTHPGRDENNIKLANHMFDRNRELAALLELLD